MKVYVAGPMTGIPKFNFPAFIEMAEHLRSLDIHIEGEPPKLEVVSPAELDDPEDRERAMASEDGSPIHYGTGKTWGDFLARDVKLIADGNFDAIVVLPGWHLSKGARLETFVGFISGLNIVYNEGENFWQVPFEQLSQAWSGPAGWEYLNYYFIDHVVSQFNEQEAAEPSVPKLELVK